MQIAQLSKIFSLYCHTFELTTLTKVPSEQPRATWNREIPAAPRESEQLQQQPGDRPGGGDGHRRLRVLGQARLGRGDGEDQVEGDRAFG